MAIASERDALSEEVERGFGCKFIDPPPYELLCLICLLPVRDPKRLSCCGRGGCAGCVGEVEVAGRPCPACGEPFHASPAEDLSPRVQNLGVFCPRKGEGCPWEGELRDLETHARKVCGYVEEACRYGCGRCSQRRLLRVHETDECPQRPPEVVTQSLIRKMTAKLDALETERRRMSLRIQELEERLQQESRASTASTHKLEYSLQLISRHFLVGLKNDGTLSSLYPPCEMIMPHFSVYKSQDVPWHSKLFYSSLGGYRLGLRVDANGIGLAKGTHVSITVYLETGSNDSHLSWPFVHDVTYGVINWSEDAHHEIRTIDFKTAGRESNSRPRANQSNASAWGFPKFLAHASLRGNNVQYLRNDCLCLRVLKVERPS